MQFKRKHISIILGLGLGSIMLYQGMNTSVSFANPAVEETSVNQQKNKYNTASNERYKLTYADTNSASYRRMINSIDSFYAIQRARGFNGSVLIGHQGKVIYERYFGTSDIRTGAQWTKNSNSQLASTSKPFTATAVLFLHQEGFLNINDPVNKYIPGFPYPAITIKMLLNQRTGLPDYTKMGNVVWKSTAPMSNKDLMGYFIKNKPPLGFKPDTRFQYSNTNYAFLASIVEVVSKMRFKDFMKEIIFEPLGMHNTYVFDPEESWHANSTVSYRANFTIFPNTFQDGIYGDKGIYSSVQDMYKWDQSFYNNTILSVATQRMAYQGYSYESRGTKNYGLGWRMIETDSSKLIYHNGWWHGNNTVFYRFIADNFTIIILGNKYNTGIYQQPKTIYKLFQNDSNMQGSFDFEETGSPSS